MNHPLPQAVPFQPTTTPRPPRDEKLIVVFSGMLTPAQAEILRDANFRIVLVQSTAEVITPLSPAIADVELMTWKQVTDPSFLYRIGTILMDSVFPWVSFSPSDPRNSASPLAAKMVEELLRRGCQALIVTNSSASTWTVQTGQQVDTVLRAGARGIARWSKTSLAPTLSALLKVQAIIHPTTPSISRAA